MYRSQCVYQCVKEDIDSFQAELEELDPLSLGNESGSVYSVRVNGLRWGAVGIRRREAPKRRNQESNLGSQRNQPA